MTPPPPTSNHSRGPPSPCRPGSRFGGLWGAPRVDGAAQGSPPPPFFLLLPYKLKPVVAEGPSRKAGTFLPLTAPLGLGRQASGARAPCPRPPPPPAQPAPPQGPPRASCRPPLPPNPPPQFGCVLLALPSRSRRASLTLPVLAPVVFLGGGGTDTQGGPGTGGQMGHTGGPQATKVSQPQCVSPPPVPQRYQGWGQIRHRLLPRGVPGWWGGGFGVPPSPALSSPFPAERGGGSQPGDGEPAPR